MNSEIISVTARQVYTRRPNPGVEAIVKTVKGSGRAICTGGVSVGSHEVSFKYDDGTKWRGKGMQNAVDTINNVIAPKLLGVDCSRQSVVDNEILGICDDAKTVLGGNAVAAVSAAALKAGADTLGIPLYRHIGGECAVTLPVPGLGAFGGSDRYGGGASKPGIKPSYSFVFYNFKSFSEASYAAWELSNIWGEALRQNSVYPSESGGGFVNIPPGVFKSEQEIWGAMEQAIHSAGYDGCIGLQIDAAGDSYFIKETGKYRGLFTAQELDSDSLLDIYIKMVKDYPFVVIEDPFHEDDYDYHAALTKAVDIQIVGDDLFTTNVQRLRQGAIKGACNAVLLKVNQIGTITEALEMTRVAKQERYQIMPCASRGEDEAIADYCVGINAGSVRESAIGIDANRFLEIEAELGRAAVFLGKKGLCGSRFQ